MAAIATLSDEVVMNKIHLIRGQKVMVDRDLGELYGVATKVLKQAVRRNAPRFPSDFMFEMTREEFKEWREKVAIGIGDRQGLRYAPFCFTEQGVTMLSCILNTRRAIEVNIQIIRIFTRLRELVLTHKDILLKLEQLERTVVNHDDEIKLIFEYIRELINPGPGPARRIGFKRRDEQ